MNINRKIISFIILSFLLVSGIFIFNSITTLKTNQSTNISLFKKEFLELGRELFKEDSTLFFTSLDSQNRIKNKIDKQTILDSIKSISGDDHNVIVINIKDKQFIKGYDNPDITSVFDKSIIESYLKENVIDQKTEFDFDNFNEFESDTTGTIVPSKILFHIYNAEGIIVGFGQNFLMGKVRIEFIERQNDALYRSQINFSIILFASVLIFVIIFMILTMQRIVINPLKKIASAVKIITDGDLNRQVEVKSRDEIGQLGVAFNEMTKKLSESYTSLSNEKSRLIASINSLKIGFAIVGVEGDFIVNNPALLHVLETNNNSISLDFITEHLKIDGEGLLSRLKRCTRDKCIVEVNEIMFGIKYLRLFLNPVFSEEGVPIGGVLLIEDITEEKVTERSRDEFFAVASHELRTPLIAIRGNSEMILDNYKDIIKNEDIIEMLGDINEASIRLIGIVNDFLEVSRLEQGNITLKRINFNIVELAEKVASSLQEEASKKNILLEIIKPEESLPEVFADKDKIDQILFNLIGNSLKFTEKGSIKITFEVIEKNIKVRVIDTGKGISIKNESLLFRKFQPAGDDVLARDVTKSTGLGLYISKMLIDKMGGSIGLEKTEAKVGSTFFFTIPLVS